MKKAETNLGWMVNCPAEFQGLYGDEAKSVIKSLVEMKKGTKPLIGRLLVISRQILGLYSVIHR